MEIYQLKTFVAVATEGNLTRAAERVFTSAPAVSAQLKALEEELGVRLFDRTPRGMSLTLAGQRLLAEAQRTLAAAQSLHATAAQIRGQVRGVVRMGTVSDPAALRLGEVFVQLAEQHPQVALQLRQGVSMHATQAVRRGELDCAWVLCEHPTLDGLEILRLQACEVVAAVPRRLSAAGQPESLEALTRLPWVATPPECGLRGPLDRLFAQAGAPVPATVTADTESAMRSMVASGLGVGLMRRDQAEAAVRDGQADIFPGWSGQTWLCWITTPEALAIPAVAAVRDTVQALWS